METPDPWWGAKQSTYEEFVAWYDPNTIPQWVGLNSDTALWGAIANPSVPDRVAIANRLLDDGADASRVYAHTRVNVLHGIFANPEHDWVLEAPLVKRLLEGGADINQKSPKFGTALWTLFKSHSRDEELQPLYDVIFARPDLDFDVIVFRSGDDIRSFRYVLEAGVRKKDMARRMKEYLAERGRTQS